MKIDRKIVITNVWAVLFFVAIGFDSITTLVALNEFNLKEGSPFLHYLIADYGSVFVIITRQVFLMLIGFILVVNKRIELLRVLSILFFVVGIWNIISVGVSV